VAHLLLSVAGPTFRFPPLLGTFGHLGKLKYLSSFLFCVLFILNESLFTK
jgi:hypothetical protein